MLSNEQILERAAQDNSIDIAEWPRVLEALLQRLHDIVYNDFPIPASPLPPPVPAPIDPEVVASTPPQLPSNPPEAVTRENSSDAITDLPAGSQSSTKENDAPAELPTGQTTSLPDTHPAYPGYDISRSQQTEEIPSEQIAHLVADADAMPPELLNLYQSSRRILEYDFVESPPYTLQRLAELILHPRKHYRFLPAFLRALDRIVSVSSPVSDFPLPTLQSPLNGGFLMNGEAQTNGIGEREGLGSDEALGGALLTPIPWLRNQSNVLLPQASPGADGELHTEGTETIEGPRGAGSVETVSVTVNGISSIAAGTGTQMGSSPNVSPTLSEQSDASTSSASSTEAQLRERGGVTQGELLRQEQEAGVVPVNPAGQPMTPRRTLMGGGAAAVGRDGSLHGMRENSIDDEQPHARGPEVMTLEDMGPQPQPVEGGAVLDMEAAVGRGRSKSPQPPVDEQTFPRTESEGMDLGEPVKPDVDPKDVEKDFEKLKDAMGKEQETEAKDADGDVTVADADSEPVSADGMEEVQSNDADSGI